MREQRIYTFVPKGNRQHAEELLGIGRWLLEIAEDERRAMKVPSWTKQLMSEDGNAIIRVLADEGNNSIVEIQSVLPVEEGGKKETERQRLLHCRVILTLADDLADADPDDGSVGWPYQGDPSFIAVEPIPVKEEDEDKIYLHTLFEVEKRQGLTIEGLNGDDHYDDWVSTIAEAKHGDQGRRLSLVDAGTIIKGATGYEPVGKFYDDDGNMLKLLVKNKTIVPKDPTSTEFKDQLSSSLMTHMNEEVTYEGYDYLSETAHPALMSDSGRHIREPFETYTSPFIFDDEDEVEPATFHLYCDVVGYKDTIEEPVGGDYPSTPQDEGNIHPVGNINGEDLRHCYGHVATISTPYAWILPDFTPRVGDSVTLWDIGVASTRHKSIWFYIPSEAKRLFPEARLLSAIFPYYIEAKEAEAIQNQFSTLTVPWNFYSKNPTVYVICGPPRDFDGNIIPGMEGQFYVPWSANWILHPFRNESWPTHLRDFFSQTDGDAEVAANPFFAHTEMSIDPQYLYADIPNRMILCIRSFFANNMNKLTGKRRVYNIKFPSFAWGSETQFGNRPYEWEVLNTYAEKDTETSAALSIENSPNFVTIKGDLVSVNLLSCIYAVSDYPAVTADKIKLSPRHGDIDLVEDSTTPVEDVITTRPWAAVQDGDWKYTNIYGAGIAVMGLGEAKKLYAAYSVEDDIYPKRMVNSNPNPYKFIERTSRGESIYSDSNEDTQYRYIENEDLMEDVTWNEEDTPESHLVHCIYRALEKAGFDIHHPICDIKLEAELYDRMVDTDTGEVISTMEA